jgi:hypothetical protein
LIFSAPADLRLRPFDGLDGTACVIARPHHSCLAAQSHRVPEVLGRLNPENDKREKEEEKEDEEQREGSRHRAQSPQT